ncbi:hypothetical protein ACH4U6_24680 [Streptomyces netropsis]|uniref:hypothetical protein n=1 Tax=Streptomyces netropsis TaxID=55404 RepID=UPI00378ECF7B
MADVSRPTSGVGTQCPNGKKPEITIDRAYDVLIHRHAVREAGKLECPGVNRASAGQRVPPL